MKISEILGHRPESRVIRRLITLFGVIAVVLAACAPQGEPAPEPTISPTDVAATAQFQENLNQQLADSLPPMQSTSEFPELVVPPIMLAKPDTAAFVITIANSITKNGISVKVVNVGNGAHLGNEGCNTRVDNLDITLNSGSSEVPQIEVVKRAMNCGSVTNIENFPLVNAGMRITADYWGLADTTTLKMIDGNATDGEVSALVEVDYGL